MADNIYSGDNGVYLVANAQTDDVNLGNSGIDTVTYASYKLQAGTADDIVKITKGNINYTVNTGDGNDSIYGDANGENAIDGGKGDDWIEGGKKHDFLQGGDGNDVIYAGAGNDTVNGGEGNDYVSGGLDDDTVDGGIGNDVVDGGAGNDTLTGGTGNDKFLYRMDTGTLGWAVDFGATWGHDTITDFQTGTDRIEMDKFFMRLADPDVSAILKAIDDAVVKNADGTFTLKNGTGDDPDFPSYFTDNSTTFADRANANKFVYKVNGLDNNIYKISIETKYDLSTNHVKFTLSFQAFDDVTKKAVGTSAEIVFNNGDDLKSTDFIRETQKLIHGTNGDDTIDLTAQKYAEALGTKGGLVYGFDGDDQLTGGKYLDSLFGGNGNDVLKGGGSGDYLRGEAGNDTLSGDDGNDNIRGGDGNDEIHGGTGNDTIYGNAGTNKLWGDDGKDIFAIGGSSVSGNGLKYDKDGHPIYALEGGLNIINDFEVGKDKIQLGNLFANFRITKVEEQNRKFAEFLDGHIKHDYNSNVVTIYTSSNNDDNNAFVVKFGDAAQADAMYQNMQAGHYDSYFVFG